jgi:Cu/Ag efflux pump CusA
VVTFEKNVRRGIVVVIIIYLLLLRYLRSQFVVGLKFTVVVGMHRALRMKRFFYGGHKINCSPIFLLLPFI